MATGGGKGIAGEGRGCSQSRGLERSSFQNECRAGTELKRQIGLNEIAAVRCVSSRATDVGMLRAGGGVGRASLRGFLTVTH